MALTAQSAVDLAREPLKDAAKVRWPDAKLLVYYNQAIMFALDKRPDLFVGQYTALPVGEDVLGTAFRLPPRYLQAVADWITGHADMEQDEAASAQRAGAVLQKFSQQLMG